MLRRLFRWVFRLVIMAVVLFTIVAVSDYLSHRVMPGSVLNVELKGPTVERGGGGVPHLGRVDGGLLIKGRDHRFECTGIEAGNLGARQRRGARPGQ